MGLLNIDPRAADEASAEWKPGGDFSLPAEGVGTPFEILGDKDAPAWSAVRTIPETGETYENFEVKCATVDNDGKEIKFYLKFRLDTEKGLSKWKTFLSSLHGKVLSGDEIAAFDTDNLIGVRFTADVRHSADSRDPKRFYANVDFKTIAVEGEAFVPPEAPKPAKPGRPASSRR